MEGLGLRGELGCRVQDCRIENVRFHGMLKGF